MKNLSPLLFLFALLIAGCASENTCEPLEKELSETKKQLQQRDSVMDAMGEAFQAVDSNLLTMRTLEAEIMQELNSGKKDKNLIRANVDKLKHIMAMNQAQLDQLRKNLDSKSEISSTLFSIVNSMEEKIVSNNLRLAELNDDLGMLGSDFKDLFDEYIQAEYKRWVLEENMQNMEGSLDEMEAQMRELKNNLNTAYIAIGTKRELIEGGVLEKGGLLKTGSINENVDHMAFKPYDTRELSRLDLGSEKVKIVTEHPTESYTLQKENGTTMLVIESSKNFWSLSKFLIVVKD